MTMTRSLKSTVLALVALAAAAGCSHNSQREAAIQPTDFEKREKEPTINANTHFAAGQLAEAQNDPAHAITQYKAALKQEPNHVGALFRLGVLYAQQKQFADAIETWQKYIKATGGSATGYSNLAFCEELAGRPEAAEADYQRGIAREPSNEPCRVNYGFMLARHGRVNEATLQFQAVLTAAQVHYNLGSVYEAQGRKEQAKAEFHKSADLDPNLSDAKAKLATLDKY